MDILDLNFRDTPFGSLVEELSESPVWSRIDEAQPTDLVQCGRRLVKESLEESGRVARQLFDANIFQFLSVYPPWGLAIIRDVPSTHPRRAFILISEILGNTVRYEDEGDYLIEIREDPSQLVTRPGFNNSKEFFPHSDLSYTDEPPTFFCLHSLVNEKEQGGFSEFVDVKELLRVLDSATVTALRQDTDFLFPAPKHFGEGASVRKPIISVNNWGQDEIRFRRDNLGCASRPAINAVVELCRAIQETMEEVFLEPGAVAVINNRRVLHGRTAFLGGALARSPRHINRLYFEPLGFEPEDGAFCE